MPSVAELMSRSKESIARSLARAEGVAAREESEKSEILSAANEYAAAGLTGPLSAGGVGFIETRFPNKDGSRLSLGPIPLPVVTGLVPMAVAPFTPSGVATHLRIVGAAHWGLAAGTYGRGWGAMRRAEVLKKKGGATTTEGEDWSAEELELLAAQ